MNTTRQDAWTKDEDIMLAETVLRYIREGKTQLEAFKEVAKQLSRTSAACGFRWNATIRKHYHEAIQFAKKERKHGSENDSWNRIEPADQERDTIETAILLLEKMRSNFPNENKNIQKEQAMLVQQLEEENGMLKERLLRYDTAWDEMGKLWKWVKTSKKE